MFNLSGKTYVSIAVAAIISMATIQALISPAAFIKAVDSLDTVISTPVSIPNEIPSTGSGGNEQSSGGNNSGSNGGSTGPTVCNDSKPGSAPRLLSAQVSKPGEVILTWSKSKDPVTHYSLVFGLKANKYQFGDTNIGSKTATSYTVKYLNQGSTYFFKVAANNGCTPGDFSNELSIKVVGKNRVGYSPAVLAATNINYKTNSFTKPTPKSTPVVEPKNETSVVSTPKPQANNNLVVNLFKSFVTFFSN